MQIVYHVTVSDHHSDATGTSLTASQDVVITINGINDAPTIGAIATQSLPELPNTTGSDTPDAITVHATFTDPDLSNTNFTTAVTAVAASGATAGLELGTAALQALLTPGTVHKDAGVATGIADFDFSAPDKTFDYLADGQKLALTYTMSIDDHHGGV